MIESGNIKVAEVLPPAALSFGVIETVKAVQPLDAVWYLAGEDHVVSDGLFFNGRELDSAVQECSRKLEEALKTAKYQHLSSGVVWFPCSLLNKISKDIILMAESEPYGLRGCVINLRYCDETMNKGIGSIKWDETIASTFEVDLILKPDPKCWSSLLPSFLRNLARCRTIVLSPGYTLEKRKLYRSYSDCDLA